MKACAFFGHRDATIMIEEKLRKVIIELIENQQFTRFYVGNEGAFDHMVCRVLQKIKEIHPKILYYVVLAYRPSFEKNWCYEDNDHCLLPDGIEKVPKRYAIPWRNQWMINKVECVVVYASRSWGGAAQAKEMALKKKKQIIELLKYE